MIRLELSNVQNWFITPLNEVFTKIINPFENNV